MRRYCNQTQNEYLYDCRRNDIDKLSDLAGKLQSGISNEIENSIIIICLCPPIFLHFFRRRECLFGQYTWINWALKHLRSRPHPI